MVLLQGPTGWRFLISEVPLKYTLNNLAFEIRTFFASSGWPGYITCFSNKEDATFRAKRNSTHLATFGMKNYLTQCIDSKYL